MRILIDNDAISIIFYRTER